MVEAIASITDKGIAATPDADAISQNANGCDKEHVVATMSSGCIVRECIRVISVVCVET